MTEAATQSKGQPGETVPDARAPEIAVVPTEELIAAITTEGHGEPIAARFSAHQMGGQLGGISEGLAIEPGQQGDQGLGIGGGEDCFAVIGAQVGRHAPGVGRFVKAGFLEPDREGGHRPATLGLKQGGDQGGIDAAREEGAEGYIGQALLLHRGVELTLQGLQTSSGIGERLGEAIGHRGAKTPPGPGLLQLGGGRTLDRDEVTRQKLLMPA